MHLEHRIETIGEKKLAGHRQLMSFAKNTTGELWRNFIPRRREFQNTVGTDLYSMQIYSENFFTHFNPLTEFEKWATVPVKDFENLPDDIMTFTLPGGLYAIFHYKGDASNAQNTFRYIFETWLPASDYIMDTRPHFEILGEKYKNGSPDSEEDIYIPIRPK